MIDAVHFWINFFVRSTHSRSKSFARRTQCIFSMRKNCHRMWPFWAMLTNGKCGKNVTIPCCTLNWVNGPMWWSLHHWMQTHWPKWPMAFVIIYCCAQHERGISQNHCSSVRQWIHVCGIIQSPVNMSICSNNGVTSKSNASRRNWCAVMLDWAQWKHRRTFSNGLTHISSRIILNRIKIEVNFPTFVGRILLWWWNQFNLICCLWKFVSINFECRAILSNTIHLCLIDHRTTLSHRLVKTGNPWQYVCVGNDDNQSLTQRYKTVTYIGKSFSWTNKCHCLFEPNKLHFIDFLFRKDESG